MNFEKQYAQKELQLALCSHVHDDPLVQKAALGEEAVATLACRSVML